MGDHDDRLPEAVDRLPEQAENLPTGAQIQRAGRPSANTTSGWVNNARARATRCCSPRKLGRPVLSPGGQPDPGEHLCERACVGPPAGKPEWRGDVLLDRERGQEVEGLEDKPIRSRRSSVSRVALNPESSVAPIDTRPSVGRSSPAATCRSVLLPTGGP